MKLENPHLIELEVDLFHHLGFGTNTNVVEKYGDVKFVCLSGSTGRAKKFAKYLNRELKFNRTEDEVLTDHCLTDRYVMYKVGPILVANHGMGVPSLQIILNELIKLLHYAKAKDVTFIRIGTSGGLGMKPGTVVLTKKAVNGCFKPVFNNMVLGEVKEYNSEFPFSNFDKMIEVGESVHKDKKYEFIVGDTMCADDFYEGQGRIDGPFCHYTKEERLKYLKKAYDHGVRNVEMECTLFASVCNQAEIPSFVICVTVVNRFESDQITTPHDELSKFEERPFDVVAAYIKACAEVVNE